MTFPRRRPEPLAQRVRARIGKRIILDTTHAQLLFERHPGGQYPKTTPCRHHWPGRPSPTTSTAAGGPSKSTAHGTTGPSHLGHPAR